VNKFARWDEDFYDDKLNSVYSWSLYTNYNTLREYIYRPVFNTCELTGPDAIYDWCYGTHPQMKYGGKTNCPVDGPMIMCDYWTMDNGFRFITLPNQKNNSICIPYASIHYDDIGMITTNNQRFIYFKEGIVNPHIFDLPPSCKALL